MTTPTADQIREAAATSPEAKAALMRLFPEVFAPKPLSTADINLRAWHDAVRGTPFDGHIAPNSDRDGFFLRTPAKHTWVLERIKPLGHGFYLRCIPISD